MDLNTKETIANLATELNRYKQLYQNAVDAEKADEGRYQKHIDDLNASYKAEIRILKDEMGEAYALLNDILSDLDIQQEKINNQYWANLIHNFLSGKEGENV